MERGDRLQIKRVTLLCFRCGVKKKERKQTERRSGMKMHGPPVLQGSSSTVDPQNISTVAVFLLSGHQLRLSR